MGRDLKAFGMGVTSPRCQSRSVREGDQGSPGHSGSDCYSEGVRITSFTYANLGVSKNRGTPPQIINFNSFFFYKPSILGYPYLETPIKFIL